MCAYKLALDSSYPTGGEVIDISGDFSNVFAVLVGGNDTLADCGYVFQAVHPGAAVAVSSTNVKITAHWSGATGAVLPEFTNAGDLSAVGELQILVIGK
jgi:hypothetical protein